jgi:hypothetical protein
VEQGRGPACEQLVRAARFDAQDDLGAAIRRGPPLRRCGLRLVVSDFLFETPFEGVVGTLGRSAAALGLIQLLAPEDVAPAQGFGARLIDCETGEALEHLLTPEILEGYTARLEAHARLLRSAAHCARAALVVAVADADVGAMARGRLFPLVVPARSEQPWP